MVTSETYLKTQQVADALGVSVSTIKRWVDAGAIEATRTMGKHRLVALSSALRFARKEKLPTDSLLAMAGSAPIAVIDDRLVEALADLLKAGKSKDAFTLMSSVYHSKQGAVGLSDLLIRPVMERIGHGWLVGSWDVYQEHQASQIVTSAINELIRVRSHDSNPNQSLAIGAAPEGDNYTLSGLLCELVLRDLGWNVRNLGVNLPLRSLASATRDYRPKLIFLSASHIADRDRFLRGYSYFYEAASQVGSAIMLGGRGLDLELRSNLVYASFGDRMAHLAEFARRLLPATEITFGANLSHQSSMDISS